MIAHNHAHSLGDAAKIAQQIDQRFASQFRGLLHSSIQIRDIGIVMFGEVDFHCARIDMGLQRVVSISKFWKFKSHVDLLVKNV